MGGDVPSEEMEAPDSLNSSEPIWMGNTLSCGRILGILGNRLPPLRFGSGGTKGVALALLLDLSGGILSCTWPTACKPAKTRCFRQKARRERASSGAPVLMHVLSTAKPQLAPPKRDETSSRLLAWGGRVVC